MLALFFCLEQSVSQGGLVFQYIPSLFGILSVLLLLRLVLAPTNNCFFVFFFTQNQTRGKHYSITQPLLPTPPVETPSPHPSLWFTSGSQCYKTKNGFPLPPINWSSTQWAFPEANGISKLSDGRKPKSPSVQPWDDWVFWESATLHNLLICSSMINHMHVYSLQGIVYNWNS